MAVFREGDLCAITIIKKTFLVRLKSGDVLHTNKGYVRHDDIIGRQEGSSLLTNLNKKVYVYRPGIIDILMSVKRATNISYPKDVAWMLFKSGVRSGHLVLEAGTGSGALASALAYAVMPEGKVYSFERRPEFTKLARENLTRAGLIDFVELIEEDISRSLDYENHFDAAFLDLPEPWTCIENVYKALRGGGSLCIFLPTVNQVERTVNALRKMDFTTPEVEELLIRSWDVKDGATRPDFNMRGHTGFIIFTRKLIPED